MYSHNWIFIQRKKGRASEIFRPRAAARRAAESMRTLPDVINKLLRAPARAKRVTHEEKIACSKLIYPAAADPVLCKPLQDNALNDLLFYSRCCCREIEMENN